MNPTDTAVLSASSVIAPSLLGILIWPHVIFVVLVAAFVVFSCLFLVFKRRNQAE